MRGKIVLIAAAVWTTVMYSSAAQAATIELVTNGDFETGTFAGWTVTDLPGSGSWFVDVVGSTTPLSGMATLGNATGGTFYAVTDQTGPGTHSLTQTLVVPQSTSVILSFDMFINDWSGLGPLGTLLSHTSGPAQFGTVDILTAAAGPFDTGAGVVGNVFYGATSSVGGPNPYATFVFDITSLVGAGGTFQLRFGEVDNQLFFNMGIDNVSVQATPVPEPATLLLLGTGLAAAGVRRRRRLAADRRV